MTGINYSNTQTDWDERALLEDLRKDIFLSLKVMDVATVVDVNYERNTLDAQINYKKTYLAKNEKPTGQAGRERPSYIPKQMDYPKLSDLPIFYFGSPEAGITVPVKAGDQCLVIYNDRALDSWFQDKNQMTLSSNRLHSLSDGVAFVGINSLSQAIEWLNNGVRIFNGEAEVTLKEKISVKNADENLSEVLQDLIGILNDLSTRISTLTVTGVTSGGGTSGAPVNAVDFTNIATQINGIGTRLGDLLE